jgi:hypothetical protein
MFHFIMNHSAETGLILFFVCFAAIAIFAATRTRRQLENWSHIPLDSTGHDDANEQEEK